VETGPEDAGGRSRGRRLEYVSTIWNSVEAIVAVASGLAAHSLALVAFGLDSLVEVFASVVVVWHLLGVPGAGEHARARHAMRLIAVAFGVLGVYLLGQAGRGFATRISPHFSPVGTAFLAATVAVMLWLAWAKGEAGRAIGDRPLLADARMSFLDGCLASGVLLALVLDRLAGWWWADPLAAAVVAVIALNEGREAWAG
jgi:divalent metal cation (Fe/Co/Zn/Cd) transporter